MDKEKVRTKTKLIYVILSMVLSFTMLTGCTDLQGVELTEEQSAAIAEYAAGLLLKYDKSHAAGLQNVYDEPEEEKVPEQAPVQVEEEEVQEVYQKVESEATKEVFTGTIGEAIGIPDLDVRFAYYETFTSLPDSDPDNPVFSMRAQDGNKMVVLHFNVTNISGETLNLDMLSNNVRYRLVINDKEVIRQQQTLLSNDLSQMSEAMEPGQVYDEVLVFETETGIVDSIENLKLTIKGNEDLTVAL